MLGRLISVDYYADIYEQYEDEDGYIWDDWYTLDVNLKKYVYTSDGKLYRVHDGLNNEYTQYSYDYNGRLESVVTYGGDFVHDFVTEYYYSPLNSIKDRISSKYQTFTYRVGTASADKCIGTLYYYDAYERLSTERISSDNVTAQLSYSYDDYNRLIGKTTASGSFTNEVTYGYNVVTDSAGSLVETGEVKTYTSNVGNTTNTYTYTYDSRGNIKTVKKGTALQYEYSYDDLGQLEWEEDFITGECYIYYYDNAGNIVHRVEGMWGAEYYYEYDGDRLISFNGESITYDEFGRTSSYRGKNIHYGGYNSRQITYFGNASFTYYEDGMRRTKTVGGVTHYYTYDGLKLIREEWGNNVLIFLYDASGSPIGMQYRNSTYASGVWDTYYYEKNLQGDIVAIYSATGTKLVSYTYDSWGYISDVAYSNGGANTSVVHNPIKYRGYYYDDDLDLYYLATRYYDPETCRFVTADDPSYLGANGDLVSYNLYAYCSNNPVMYVDPTGHFALTTFIIGVAAFALIGGIVGGIISYNSAKEQGLDGIDLFAETTKGIGKGIAAGTFAGCLAMSTAGAIVTYGIGSIASTAMITFSANVTLRSIEVAALQYKKSTNDGKSGWQIAENILSSSYNNIGRILSPAGTKTLTTFTGYSMHRGYFQAKQLSFNAYMGAYSSWGAYALSYAFLLPAVYNAYLSITTNDPVRRAHERGFSLI